LDVGIYGKAEERSMNAPQKSSTRRERHHHGILQDSRGQDQPTDKSRAQQAEPDKEAGEQAQRDAANDQPISPGEPAGGE
jgi:hypothetical protein